MVEFVKVPVSARARRVHALLEGFANHTVRAKDRWLGRLRLGGRRADYDDVQYCFEGGPNEAMRAKHYDKSLRLLWKAEEHAPWSSFHDATRLEQSLASQAAQAMSTRERKLARELAGPEFRELLQREYTPREQQALVNVLSAIGHGEAYAWLVASDMVGTLHSTGAKAAVTAQVIEEAKHFVVLRELVQAFDKPVPRLTAWEYMLLEGVMRLNGLEKLFGMNVVVEGIALSIFGMLGHLPGMELLRLFHLDESRHTALPQNYVKAFPLTRWQKYSPVARLNRLRLVLVALPLVFALEDDLAELGVDVFDFGGSVLRKVGGLAERAGFYLPISVDRLGGVIDLAFNGYCLATRPEHSYRKFTEAETTRDRRSLEVERLALA